MKILLTVLGLAAITACTVRSERTVQTPPPVTTTVTTPATTTVTTPVPPATTTTVYTR